MFGEYRSSGDARLERERKSVCPWKGLSRSDWGWEVGTRKKDLASAKSFCVSLCLQLQKRFLTSIRTCQEMQSCRWFLSRSIILPSRRSWSMQALTALSPGSIRQQENQSHARSMRCCHPILQERPLPAICTKMSRTLTWSVPLPVTKKAAKPSTVTAWLTRKPIARLCRIGSRSRVNMN